MSIIWYYGLYLRLSKEDGDDIESESITNQRSIMEIFLRNEKNAKKFKFYIDDGYTGTDFERPEFMKLINDIESGKINCIIVKDLSRLGRNYIGVGKIIENIIKKYNVRFISINDNIDSYKNPKSMDGLELAFKNLMNEGYAKDISNKMRTSLKSSKRRGNFIGKYAPYGYIKDKEDCHKFIVDPEAASVVKKIFSMILEGHTRQQVVEYLNLNHILTPSIYFKEILHYDINNVSKEWNLAMVDNILRNRTYTGDLVQSKRERISHKNHSLVRTPEEDWIISDDHHKKIAKKKVFDQVNDILYSRNNKVNKDGCYYPFTGYIKCADCGTSLYRKFKTKKKKKIAFYYCGKYLTKKECTKHYINEKMLKEIVLSSINKYIELMCDLNKKINEVVKESSIEYNEEIKKIKIVEITKEIKKFELLLEEVRKDYMDDIISKKEFDNYNNEYLYRLNKLKIDKENLKKKDLQSINLEWIKKISEKNKFEEINKNIVDEFIDVIYVTEDSNVKIIFKFKDQYKEAIEFLKNKNL